MKIHILIFAALFFLLAGCTNAPSTNKDYGTPIYHPQEQPEKSHSEIVKYDNITPKMHSTPLTYETFTGGTINLFASNEFCYDKQNDYFVIPKKQDTSITSTGDSLFVIIPRNSITLCKDGANDTTFAARNRALKGFTIGTISGAITFAVISIPLAAILSGFAGEASAFWQMELIAGALGAGTGGVIGAIIGAVVTEDPRIGCKSYYHTNPKELEALLEQNRCY